MKHFVYLTLLTALWVGAVLISMPKGPYWEYLEEVDLYTRAARYESCQPAARELEYTLRACAEMPGSGDCDRMAGRAKETKRCLDRFEQ